MLLSAHGREKIDIFYQLYVSKTIYVFNAFLIRLGKKRCSIYLKKDKAIQNLGKYFRNKIGNYSRSRYLWCYWFLWYLWCYGKLSVKQTLKLF